MKPGTPPTPAMPLPPPAAHPPTLAALLKPQKADSGKYTAGGTIATSPMGLKSPPSITNTTLLGQ